ncbi:MAG: SWIM zinc finger family protein [Roseovarius sp.]|nr:SWIM zinc finger family protein [Roseovarius sp.]
MAYYSKTWWGNVFLDALDNCMDSGRLSRGRSYSSPHRLSKFSIHDGTISGTMMGNKNPHFGVYETPYYKVEVRLAPLGAPQKKMILDNLGNNANWVAHFIIGEIPAGIDDALSKMGIPLLPRDLRDIKSKCSCPDYAVPCKHVAGIYYHVAGKLDHDPMLLFELRGLKRGQIMDALAKTEIGKALLDDDKTLADSDAARIKPLYPEVEVEHVHADPADMRNFWLGKPLPRDTRADMPPPPVSVLPMRRAGDYPEFWRQNHSFLETMSLIYESAAKGVKRRPLKGEVLLNSK